MLRCSVVSFETYVGGYGILPYPRSQNIGVEVLSCSVVSFETYVGGYGILPYPRSQKIGFDYGKNAVASYIIPQYAKKSSISASFDASSSLSAY